MRCSLISIGDELLIGQTINTNASWLGKELSAMGIRIIKTLTISDDRDAIRNAIDDLLEDAEVILITGGLGPTKDDITKHVLCEYFDTHLEIDPITLAKIEGFFARRNRPMLEVNRQQAALPAACTILSNDQGTAPGMLFEKNGKWVVSLPGVPYEMKGIFTAELIPRFIERFELRSLYHKTFLTSGIGESFLAEIISEWENKVRELGFGLAYLPSPGLVKLRLTSYEGDGRAEEVDVLFSEIEEVLREYHFGYENETLSSGLGKLLRDSGMTIGTIESCTGGSIAAELTSASGASDYFLGSIITYSNEMKIMNVGVEREVIEQNGAVSQPVVDQMAFNGRIKLGVDLCVSVSGIAGPNGGTEEKPVGTVWIAVATKERVFSKKFNFGDDRERNIKMSVFTALNMARREILGLNKEKI
jgi:nicotinamide-nucleotide amidase